MAKQKDINKMKRWAKKPIRKATDEYTGFPLYTDDSETDYKGRLVKKGTAEPLPLDDPKYRRPPRASCQLPFARPEPTPQLLREDQVWEIIWNECGEYWDESEIEL